MRKQGRSQLGSIKPPSCGSYGAGDDGGGGGDGDGGAGD